MSYTREEIDIMEAAHKLEKIYEDYLLEDPEIAAPFMAEAREIIRSIEIQGYLVQKFFSISSLYPGKADVEIVVLKPKPNLPSDLQKIYDEWLLSKQGIKKE